MERHVSVDSLGSSSRPTQTELYSQKQYIKKFIKKQYKYTYFCMVILAYSPKYTLGDIGTVKYYDSPDNLLESWADVLGSVDL